MGCVTTCDSTVVPVDSESRKQTVIVALEVVEDACLALRFKFRLKDKYNSRRRNLCERLFQETNR